jgi:uncharacterized protein (DUF1810 family)
MWKVLIEFDHFIEAQNRVYDQVIRELTEGQKQTHWMWYIFPQVKGLGFSEISNRYGLSSVDEARRYLEHELLGARLRECTQLVIDIRNRTAEDIFGHIDAMKFRSSMTLFSQCSPSGSLFDLAIEKYFEGKRDPKTLKLLGLQDDSIQ